jgi:hypothetical protein
MPQSNCENTSSDVSETSNESFDFFIKPPSLNPADRLFSLEQIAAHASSGPGALEANQERKAEKQREIAELRGRLNAVLSGKDPEILRNYNWLLEKNSLDDLGQLSVIVTQLEKLFSNISRRRSATILARKKRSLPDNSAHSEA